MTPCCDQPACVRSAVLTALRDRTYPLVVPVRIDPPHVSWRRSTGRVFLLAWGWS